MQGVGGKGLAGRHTSATPPIRKGTGPSCWDACTDLPPNCCADHMQPTNQQLTNQPTNQPSNRSVGNLLGEGLPRTARTAGWLTTGLGGGFMAVCAAIILGTRHVLGYVFTNDVEVGVVSVFTFVLEDGGCFRSLFLWCKGVTGGHTVVGWCINIPQTNERILTCLWGPPLLHAMLHAGC